LFGLRCFCFFFQLSSLTPFLSDTEQKKVSFTIMSVEFELRSLDQLLESGFIQEAEYHARRAQLLQANSVSSFQPGHFTALVELSEPEARVVKETNSEALPPQPVAQIAQQSVRPEQRQRVLPKQGA
jgi:hypothetical protein